MNIRKKMGKQNNNAYTEQDHTNRNSVDASFTPASEQAKHPDYMKGKRSGKVWILSQIGVHGKESLLEPSKILTGEPLYIELYHIRAYSQQSMSKEYRDGYFDGVEEVMHPVTQPVIQSKSRKQKRVDNEDNDNEEEMHSTKYLKTADGKVSVSLSDKIIVSISAPEAKLDEDIMIVEAEIPNDEELKQLEEKEKIETRAREAREIAEREVALREAQEAAAREATIREEALREAQEKAREAARQEVALREAQEAAATVATLREVALREDQEEAARQAANQQVMQQQALAVIQQQQLLAYQFEMQRQALANQQALIWSNFFSRPQIGLMPPPFIVPFGYTLPMQPVPVQEMPAQTEQLVASTITVEQPDDVVTNQPNSIGKKQ